MTRDVDNQTHYTADEGKIFKRIIDGFIMGNNIYLGKYINDTDDVIENYEEVDDPDAVETTDK